MPDLGEISPSPLFMGPEEPVNPFDCDSPSLARVLEPTSFFGSELEPDRPYNMFEPPPSEMTTSSQQGPSMIILDDTDDVSPPLNKTKNDPLYVRARELLNTIIAKGADGPLPIPVPKIDNHLPSTRYYGG